MLKRYLIHRAKRLNYWLEILDKTKLSRKNKVRLFNAIDDDFLKKNKPGMMDMLSIRHWRIIDNMYAENALLSRMKPFAPLTGKSYPIPIRF